MTAVIAGEFQSSINNEDTLPLGESERVTYLSNRSIKTKKTLGFSHGFSLIVGLILGSGVFISPGLVARDTSSPGMEMIMWVVAGIVALLGALCYCEIGCMFKMAGGNYANILNIYGEGPAFMTSWATCLVIDPSSISAIALTIGTYFAKPFYDTDKEGETTAKLIAFGLIILCFFINSVNGKITNIVQRGLSVVQILSVVFVIVIGIWQLVKNKAENFHDMFGGTVIDKHSPLHIGIALFGALWSYDGWAQMSNVIEEIENVERNLLLTIITGIPFVIFCYIMANIAFLSVLTHSQMASSEAVAIDFIDTALGVKTSYLMMVLVALSAFGTLNGSFFACPRLTMAAARERHMPFVFSLLHKKNEQPIPASILILVISSLMLLPNASNLNTLILLFSQAQWVIYTASIFGVVVLRIRRPSMARPFKVFIGIPILITIIGVYLVVMPFFRDFWLSLTMFGFIILGIPVYFICVRFHLKQPGCCLNFMDALNMKAQSFFNLVPCSKS